MGATGSLEGRVALVTGARRGIGAAIARRLAAEAARSREHRSEHAYSLEEYGLTRREIRDALAPLFERFGWSE